MSLILWVISAVMSLNTYLKAFKIHRSVVKVSVDLSISGSFNNLLKVLTSI